MRSIDGFEVVRELGRGGMGVVYEARHPSLPRSVALKLILEDAADSEALLRFGREAELLARLSHRNVVRVHKLGRSPEGPYLVTELLDGQDLQELTRARVLGHAQIAELMRALAEGVAAVNAVGIVHRDLKPQNVFVRPDGSPVLLDFGIARDVGAEKLTQTGVVVGTPAFMAPEQAGEGSRQELDARTDVYGLGAILFSLLARRPPFTGPLVTILKRVLFDDPRWPSADDPSVPRDLEAICKQAMAKEVTERYASAQAMADDLGRFLAGEAVLARPPVRLGRRRALAFAGVGLGVALLAGVVGVALRGAPADSGPGVAVVESATPLEPPERPPVEPPSADQGPRLVPGPAVSTKLVSGHDLRLLRPPQQRDLYALVIGHQSSRVLSYRIDESNPRVPKLSDPESVDLPQQVGPTAIAVHRTGSVGYVGAGSRVFRVRLVRPEGDAASGSLRPLLDALPVVFDPKPVDVRSLLVSEDGSVLFVGYWARGEEGTGSYLARVAGPGAEQPMRSQVKWFGPGGLDSLALVDAEQVIVAAATDSVSAPVDAEGNIGLRVARFRAQDLSLLGEVELPGNTQTDNVLALRAAAGGERVGAGFRRHGLAILPGHATGEALTCASADAAPHQMNNPLMRPTLPPAHSAPVRDMAFSPDGTHMLSTCAGAVLKGVEGTPYDAGRGDVRVFDALAGGQPLAVWGQKVLPGNDVTALDLGWARDGRQVVCLTHAGAESGVGSIRVARARGLQRAWTKVREIGGVGQDGHLARFVDHGEKRYVALIPLRAGSSEAARLTVWDVTDPSAAEDVESLGPAFGMDRVSALEVVPGQPEVAVLGMDAQGEISTLWIHPLASGREPRAVRLVHEGRQLATTGRLALSEGGALAYLFGTRGNAPVLVRVDLKVEPPRVTHVQAVEGGHSLRGLCVLPGGAVLTADNNSSRGAELSVGGARFRLWGGEDLAPLESWRGEALSSAELSLGDDGATTLRLSPSRKTLAVGTKGHSVRAYRVGRGVSGLSGYVRCDGGGARGSVEALGSGGIPGHESPAANAPSKGLVFSRGETRLLSVSALGRDNRERGATGVGDLRVFDVATGRLLSRYPDPDLGEDGVTHRDFVQVDLSADGTLVLVSACKGRVWLLQPPPGLGLGR